MRSPMAAVAVAVATGCVVHGGPSVGWRSRGTWSVGWHAGVGPQVAGLVGGESYVDGRAFRYGALALRRVGDASDPDGPVDRGVTMLGAVAGVGEGDRGIGYVVGAEALYFAGVDPDDSAWGLGFACGVRWLAREVEIYATAQFMFLTAPAPR